MYILKVKGSSSIPDFVQVRDDDFTLIAYFKANEPERGIKRSKLEEYSQKIIEAIRLSPYGKITKI